jgi:hypothetical protein
MKCAQVPHIQTHNRVEKEKKILIKAVMHFTAVLVLQSGMVRVVSFRILFHLDHECGKLLFCH